MISDAHSEAARANLAKARAARPKVAKVELRCEHCGGPFFLYPSQATNSATGSPRRFCSRACRYAHMRGDEGSNAGGGSHMRGAGNPNWKGGKSAEERARVPFMAEWAAWRRRVYHRDGYACRRCGLKPKTRSTLRAHHVAPWAQYPELRFDLDNGVTLCRDCHGWVHGKANTERELLK